jgi:type II secretory pathway pseudopilin PulG
MMVEVSLALIIAGLAAAGTVRELVRQQALRAAETEADTLGLYRQALQDYVDENYTALQFSQPITRNGVNLNAGGALGETLQPSVANLQGMGYLNAGFSDVALTVDGGVFRNVIQQDPGGCVGVACNIVGLAYISVPVAVKGGGGAADALLLGQMLNRLGGLGGFSVPGAAANITGSGAAWTWPNPVAGTPAGVIAARFGFGSSVFAGYVRMNETRNPNLQGDLTVGGATTFNSTLTVNGNSTFTGSTTFNGSITATGDITARDVNARNITATGTVAAQGQISSSNAVGASDVVGCLRAALEADGGIASRAADCIDRVRISNNGVALNDATGVQRISLGSATGVLAVNTAAGAQNIALDGGTGRMSAQRVAVTTTASRGTACVDGDDIVTDVEASGTILVCKGGVWRAPGLPQSAAGDACTNEGALARNTSDQALICRSFGGVLSWSLLNERVTSVVVADIWSGNGVANVPQPTCGTSGTADISVAALQGGADYGVVPPRNRFEVRVSGTGPWTVTPAMVDPSGNAYTADTSGTNYDLGWTATTFCRYSG